MDMMVKAAALAMVAAVFCVMLRGSSQVVAVLLSMAACVGILLLGLRFLEPAWSVMRQMQELSGLSDSVTAPVLKVTGIGLLTHIGAGVCQDAGEASLGKTVEISGSVLALYAALPLLSAVLDTLRQLLGGIS